MTLKEILTAFFVFIFMFKVTSAWTMLENNNSTAVGAYNLIACGLANGLPTNATAAGMEDESFVIIVGDGPRNETLETVLSQCYWIYGNSISFSTVQNLDYDGEPAWAHNVEDIIANLSLLTGIGRNSKLSEQSVIATDSLVALPAAATTTTTTTTLVGNMSKNSKRWECIQLQWYGFYASNDNNCQSNELFISYTGQCINEMNSFENFKIDNPSTCYGLNVEVWPHHDCSKGNSRTYRVNAFETGPCVKRRTYSWTGAYDDIPCHSNGLAAVACLKDASSVVVTVASLVAGITVSV